VKGISIRSKANLYAHACKCNVFKKSFAFPSKVEYFFQWELSKILFSIFDDGW